MAFIDSPIIELKESQLIFPSPKNLHFILFLVNILFSPSTTTALMSASYR